MFLHVLTRKYKTQLFDIFDLLYLKRLNIVVLIYELFIKSLFVLVTNYVCRLIFLPIELVIIEILLPD